jgi:hypothetical protein
MHDSGANVSNLSELPAPTDERPVADVIAVRQATREILRRLGKKIREKEVIRS